MSPTLRKALTRAAINRMGEEVRWLDWQWPERSRKSGRGVVAPGRTTHRRNPRG